MADQDQQQGQQRQRREPPRLVVTHHEFGRKVKKVPGDMLENSVTIWVTKENVGQQPEEVYCSFRVNQRAPATQEQLLGEDGICTEALRFHGLHPHVEVRLRWRHDQDPGWRPLGRMEFPDPNKDPNHDLFFQRMFIRWFGTGRGTQNQNNQP